MPFDPQDKRSAKLRRDVAGALGLPVPRTKVLLSVGADELDRIDAQAEAAGMSRSAYLVAMGVQGGANIGQVIAAVQHLELELRRFQADAAGWRTEVSDLQSMVEKMQKKLDAATGAATKLLDVIEIKDMPAKAKAAMRGVLDALEIIW
jgi:phage shock protein A